MKVLLIIFKNLFFLGIVIYLFTLTVAMVDIIGSKSELNNIIPFITYLLIIAFSYYVFRKLNNILETIYNEKGNIAFLVLWGWQLLYIFVSFGLCTAGLYLADLFYKS